MARLADYGIRDRDAVTLRLEDLEGEEVKIMGAEIRDGNWGDFAVMDVMKEDAEVVTVVTGAIFVIDALKDATVKKAFPLDARFFKRGRTWIFE